MAYTVNLVAINQFLQHKIKFKETVNRSHYYINGREASEDHCSHISLLLLKQKRCKRCAVSEKNRAMYRGVQSCSELSLCVCVCVCVCVCGEGGGGI